MIAFADAAMERIENRLRDYAAVHAGAAVPGWLKDYARDVNFLLSLVADLRDPPVVAVQFNPPTPEENEEARRLCAKHLGTATPVVNSPDGVKIFTTSHTAAEVREAMGLRPPREGDEVAGPPKPEGAILAWLEHEATRRVAAVAEEAGLSATIWRLGDPAPPAPSWRDLPPQL